MQVYQVILVIICCEQQTSCSRRVASPEVADDRRNSMAFAQSGTMDVDGDFLDAVFMNENRYVIDMSRNVLEKIGLIFR